MLAMYKGFSVSFGVSPPKTVQILAVYSPFNPILGKVTKMLSLGPKKISPQKQNKGLFIWSCLFKILEKMLLLDSEMKGRAYHTLPFLVLLCAGPTSNCSWPGEWTLQAWTLFYFIYFFTLDSLQLHCLSFYSTLHVRIQTGKTRGGRQLWGAGGAIVGK